ncbi:hypothetical protein [Saccharopolyspora sp. NPDC050642]|uniref:hypothetical protein n=1 Tax=Saccharopolyspora sp. NPDC050642 TaxID=3157099 RepID=UPI0033F017A7
MTHDGCVQPLAEVRYEDGRLAADHGFVARRPSAAWVRSARASADVVVDRAGAIVGHMTTPATT